MLMIWFSYHFIHCKDLFYMSKIMFSEKNCRINSTVFNQGKYHFKAENKIPHFAGLQELPN